jgi:hypothetical protein
MLFLTYRIFNHKRQTATVVNSKEAGFTNIIISFNGKKVNEPPRPEGLKGGVTPFLPPYSVRESPCGYYS